MSKQSSFGSERLKPQTSKTYSQSTSYYSHFLRVRKIIDNVGVYKISWVSSISSNSECINTGKKPIS